MRGGAWCPVRQARGKCSPEWREPSAAEARGLGWRSSAFLSGSVLAAVGEGTHVVETTAASSGMQWPGAPEGEDQAGRCLQAPR